MAFRLVPSSLSGGKYLSHVLAPSCLSLSCHPQTLESGISYQEHRAYAFFSWNRRMRNGIQKADPKNRANFTASARWLWMLNGRFWFMLRKG